MDYQNKLGGVNWQWQAADAAMGKARLGEITEDPIPPTEAKPGESAACWSRPPVVLWG